MEGQWKAARESLLKTLLMHVGNEKGADVWFLVGREEERIPAHTAILAMRSPVFLKMLTGAMSESSPAKKKEGIRLPEFSPKVFRQLLKFIYSSDLSEELHPSTVLDLLECANFFQVEDLKKICSYYAKTEALSLTSVLDILKSAYLHEADELVAYCLDFIDHNAKQVLASTALESVPSEVLKLILQRDSLEADELSVFSSVSRWIYKNDKKYIRHHQSKSPKLVDHDKCDHSEDKSCGREDHETLAGTPEKKRKTGPHITQLSRELLSLVCFQDMSVKDVICVVEPSGLLPPAGLLDVYRAVAAREAHVADEFAFAGEKERNGKEKSGKKRNGGLLQQSGDGNPIRLRTWWRTKSRCGPITCIEFSTQKSRRGKGLFWFLGTKGGTRPYRNPHRSRLVTVTCSSLQTGYPERWVDIAPSPLSTYNCLNSWMAVALVGSKYLFRATHYSISRYPRAFSPRSWKLQGSVDGENWVTLDEHVDSDVLDVAEEEEGNAPEEEHLEEEGNGGMEAEGHKEFKNPQKVAAFPLSGESQQRWFSAFRILQTDRNTGGNYKLCMCCFELYGMLRRNDNSTPKRVIVY